MPQLGLASRERDKLSWVTAFRPECHLVSARRMKPFSFQTPRAQLLGNAAAAACFFSSGFLALVYEICWIRKASLVFGAASFAMGTVLGVFFAGLAIGSYVSGRYAQRSSRPLASYAVIEILISIAAITSPIAFGAADHALGWLYPSVGDHFWALCTVRLLIVAALLLPPAVLMGTTLPLFCQHFAGSLESVQRRVGLLYGINTFGAAIGCAICGFLLIPTLGADVTLRLGGLSNLVVAAAAWLVDRSGRAAKVGVRHTPYCHELEATPRASGSTRCRALAPIFFVMGFVALANEIIWARFLSLLTHNTVYTYTLTLTVILSGIVIGSILAATPLFHTISPAATLGGVQVAAAIVVLGTLSLPVEVWQGWSSPEGMTWQLCLVAMIMLPSSVLSGIAFPLAARLVTRRPDETAARVGWLAAVNTFGGLVGSFIVGFGTLHVMGLHATVLMTTAASVLVGLIAWWRIDEHLSKRAKWSLSVIACGIWVLIPLASSSQIPADFLAAHGELVEVREGLSGHVAVVRGEEGQLRLEVDRLWQGENRHTHQVLAAHLPMALHDKPRRILVIGLGPGQTASRFLMYPVERLDCVDIENELLTLLPKYFGGSWLRDPRVRCIVEDGRNYLWHTNRQYDVISIEVGQAFRPGVAAFYTHDFYERAKTKLSSDGLLTQFVSLEFFNREELRTVIGTFADVFSDCALFHNRSELLLVGKRDGKLALRSERVDELMENVQVRRDLNFSYWGAADARLCQPHMFVANFLAGSRELKRFSAGARIARDGVPWLEFATSSHRTPEIQLAKTELERHLTPLEEFFESDGPQDYQQIAAIRQRNLDNLLSEEYIWQARQRLQDGDADRAITLLQQALRWNQDHVGARVLLGDALASRGRYEAASDELRAALATNPGLTFVEERLKALPSAPLNIDAPRSAF